MKMHVRTLLLDQTPSHPSLPLVALALAPAAIHTSYLGGWLATKPASLLPNVHPSTYLSIYPSNHPSLDPSTRTHL